MKNIVAILVLVISIPAHAFDFHGIKSGMTMKQVSDVTKQLGVSLSQDGSITIGDKGLPGVKLSPERITTAYDDHGRLYQLTLVYPLLDYATNQLREYSDPEREALKLALENKYQATVITGKARYYVQIVDREMLESYVSYLKKRFTDSL